MDKIKAIFFDADETIVDHKECEKQALMHLFDSIGISYKDEYQDIFRPLDRMLWVSGFYDGISVSAKDIPTYRFKLLFEKLNISYGDYIKANDLFKIGLANSVALIENADEVIEYLHNKGYMLCVVTNGLIELQKPRVSNSKIGKFISHIMASEEVGAHKPNPLIFNTLLKRIDLNLCDVIMIGDSLKNDIQGAKNANIKAVWYNPEHSKNETGISPDYEINDLLQLKEMF
ncbi:MAG: YjjG family noncanonical pyrimidine nucleotidase [Oscillospiraceae bacterium]|nr:YjjG family noncanonical pyrimidine nucleotidase [Oscillospiraceae bacterium]